MLALLALLALGHTSTATLTYTIPPCGAPGCDLAPALQGAIDACERAPLIPGDLHVGCRFDLPVGSFALSKPIELCRAHDVIGQGGGGWGSRTRLVPATTGIRLLDTAECLERGRGKGAAWSTIRDLAILPRGTRTATPTFGIEARARFFGRSLWIKGGTQGIHIKASARSGSGNANLTRLDDVLIERSEHAGVYFDGPDANAGLLVMPSVTSACREASRWEASFGTCAGIVDSSFLGNTILASHTNNAADVTGPVRSPRPGYMFEGDSNRGLCLGCYRETNQADGIISRNAIALGGLGTWTGLKPGFGLRIDGPWVSGMSITNKRDPNNVVTLHVGDLAAPGTWLQFEAAQLAPTKPARFKADPRRRLYLIDIANSFDVASFAPR